MPDTRVFVKGLPPHYTSEQLGAHFAGRYQITDAVVIPNRRIGFVGFRNYTLAKNAVKYFDKSYIRLSKISVEIARPVDFHHEINADPEPEPQNVRNPETDQNPVGVMNNDSMKSKFTPYDPVTSTASSKRKRTDVEAQTYELKGHADTTLDRSQSAGAKNGPALTVGSSENKNNDEPTEIGKVIKEKRVKKDKLRDGSAPELDESEMSESERKRGKKEKREKKRLLETNSQAPNEEAVIADQEARKKRKTEKKRKRTEAESIAEGGVEPLNDDASGLDDAETDTVQPEIPRSEHEWLRGKTSRLLDLMEQDEQIDNQELAPQAKVLDLPDEPQDAGTTIIHTESPNAVRPSDTTTASSQPRATGVPVPNGRLFVRNLPFSATEADLGSTFAKYGTILEVSIPFHTSLHFSVMNPDRDNLCNLAFDENQEAYFSRCCSILIIRFALIFLLRRSQLEC